VPITFVAQGYDTRSPHFLGALGYLAVCFVLWFHGYLDRVHRNQLWRYGLRGLLGGRQVKWEDQIVVVTGGASGLGRQIVETLAVRHITVVVLDRTKYIAEWDDVYSYEVDVSNRDEVLKVAKRIRDEVGDPTVLINNAGVVSRKNILDLTEEDVRRCATRRPKLVLGQRRTQDHGRQRHLALLGATGLPARPSQAQEWSCRARLHRGLASRSLNLSHRSPSPPSSAMPASQA
jgi:hypothetical protein